MSGALYVYFVVAAMHNPRVRTAFEVGPRSSFLGASRIVNASVCKVLLIMATRNLRSSKTQPTPNYLKEGRIKEYGPLRRILLTTLYPGSEKKVHN